MTLEYRGIPILCMLLLAGCGIAPSGSQLRAFAPAAETVEVDPSFRPGMEVLCAWDSGSRALAPDAEDSLLLGVKVASEESDQVWFIRLTTLAPNQEDGDNDAPTTKEFSVPFGIGGVKTGCKFTCPINRLLVETYDDHGVLLRSSIRNVPKFTSSLTMLDVLGSVSSDDQPSSAANAQATEDLARVMTLMQLTGGSRALFPIREAIRDHVISRPSIIGLMLAAFRLKVEAPMDSPENAANAAMMATTGKRDARFPVLLSGQRLFDCRVVVGPTAPPYNMTAGALLMEAVHPENAKKRLTICVLAGRHGAAPTRDTVAAR